MNFLHSPLLLLTPLFRVDWPIHGQFYRTATLPFPSYWVQASTMLHVNFSRRQRKDTLVHFAFCILVGVYSSCSKDFFLALYKS
jgi:hypothetical protein